jgi:arginase
VEAYEKKRSATAFSRSQRVRLIPVPCGLGARDKRCGAGPQALLDGGLIERLVARGALVRIGPAVVPGAGPMFRVIADVCGRLAREVHAVLTEDEFPLVIGGDHSCAVGTWSGAAKAIGMRGPIGLVWIDAHMDSHTPGTSHTGRPHGMPVAALLGRGDGQLAQHGALSPAHVCLVGVRSFEPEEAELVARIGLRVITVEEVLERGIAAALGEAVRIASTGTAAYGISLDLDAVDPREAPGVGTPVAGGIAAAELVEALRPLARDERLAGFELVEYNPALDVDGRTAALAEELLAAVLVR